MNSQTKSARMQCSCGIVIVFAMIFLIGCASNDPKLLTQRFRDDFTASMNRAAERAGVKLLTTDVAISTRGDYVIANALLVPPTGVPLEKAMKISLVYVSYSTSHPCAARIPSGFYTFERFSKPGTNYPLAKLVNLDGQTVWELPLNVKVYKKEPQEGGPPYQGPTFFAEATITQSQSLTNIAQTVITAHETVCYPKDNVWYWIWSDYDS